MLAVEEPEGALDVKVGTASGTPSPLMLSDRYLPLSLAFMAVPFRSDSMWKISLVQKQSP